MAARGYEFYFWVLIISLTRSIHSLTLTYMTILRLFTIAMFLKCEKLGKVFFQCFINVIHTNLIVNYKSETHVSKCLTNTSIVTRKIKIRRKNVWVCSENKNITYDSIFLFVEACTLGVRDFQL